MTNTKNNEEINANIRLMVDFVESWCTYPPDVNGDKYFGTLANLVIERNLLAKENEQMKKDLIEVKELLSIDSPNIFYLNLDLAQNIAGKYK